MVDAPILMKDGYARPTGRDALGWVMRGEVMMALPLSFFLSKRFGSFTNYVSLRDVYFSTNNLYLLNTVDSGARTEVDRVQQEQESPWTRKVFSPN